MRGKARTVAVAGFSALALLTAACGGSDSGSSTASSSTAGGTGGDIVVNGCNPQNPLIAGNTGETCGGDVLNVLNAQLVHYNAKDAAPENDIAQSITTDDNQHFTVKLKQGYKFQDGTEVKAHNFVDAWNYTAYGPNGYYGAYFMGAADIEGAGDLACPDADCKKKPKTDKMSGLKVVDDYTFTITTSEKVSNLPVRLGYAAFAPMPDSFFKDPKAFGKNPIGAGPYKFDHWTENQEIVVTKFADYSGDFAGKADKITFKIYQNTDAAYADLLGGTLDVINQIPTADLTDQKYKSDLPDRNASRSVGAIQTISANAKVDPNYKNPDVMKAISMAIDRKTIIDQIFAGTREPATDWTSPVVNGYKAGICGEYCTYSPDKAKALLQQAGGFPGNKITLSYNADGDHKAWTEATCNSIKNALGVDCVATPVVDFATFRDQISNRKMKGLFRTGWQMDYPSIENFLGPIYGTGAGANDADYSNPKFDALLKQAAAASSLDQANSLYQQAEGILAQDFPSIPMWYYSAQVGWSKRVSNVQITAFGYPDLTQVTVTQ